MALHLDFEADMKRLLLEKFQRAGLKVREDLGLDKLSWQYFNMRLRAIEPRSRNVHYSQELLAKVLSAKPRAALNSIAVCAKNGQNLVPYLSKRYIHPEVHDALLFDWGIYHLHLGSKVEPSGFISRTSELLYVYVKPDDIYFLDILGHDFANLHLLEILHKNWPDVIASFKIAGFASKLSNKDIKTLRSKNVSTFYTVSDGTTYFPPGGEYMSSGHSFHSIRSGDLLRFKIIGLQNELLVKEYEIREQLVSAKGSCPESLDFKMIGWDEHGVLTIEKGSGYEVRFSWLS